MNKVEALKCIYCGKEQLGSSGCAMASGAIYFDRCEAVANPSRNHTYQITLDAAQPSSGISIEVYQEDWIPGFAAFHDDGNLKDTAKAHVVLNLAANLLAVEDGDIPKGDLPYIIAENIMHEVIHVLEAWCDQEFNEERVEALLTKYRNKYKPDAPAYTNPAIGSEFPKEHGSDAVSGGVEGAHEGTTADKSGSREPEKLNNAHKLGKFIDDSIDAMTPKQLAKFKKDADAIMQKSRTRTEKSQ